MQMYEAAHRSLREIGRPTHLRDLLAYIQDKGYFVFGAKDPVRALGVCLDRHSKGVTIAMPLEPQLFYRARPATYALIDWLNEGEREDLQREQEEADAERELVLDTSLFLEHEWHRWLFKNLEENGLIDLGFGPLCLHDRAEQESKYGRFNTSVVGEIDFLLRTNDGDFVVIELKRKGDDETVGQICRYVGWVGEELASGGQSVHGVIVASQIAPKMRYAIKAVGSNIHYQQLILSVSLGERSKGKP